MKAFALCFVSALGVWSCICISLRRQRQKLLASMDPVKDAHKLLWYMYTVEFPFLTQRSVEFASLMVLAIPSITLRLDKSKRVLKDFQKRAAETDIILSEILHNHVDSNRGSYALQRLNAVHAPYNISNEDYLYVLCLEVLNPIRFAERFGYRQWTEQEQLASYIVWHDVGVRMGIKSIPNNIAQMKAYVDEFEAKYAVYDQLNHTTMRKLETVAFPWFIRPLAECVASSVMNERLRIAVGLPKLPWLIKWMITSSMKLVLGTTVSLFMPPRPEYWSKNSIQIDWKGNPPANPNDTRPLLNNKYNQFGNGYKLSELGPIKKLVKPTEGALLCPLRSFYPDPI